MPKTRKSYQSNNKAMNAQASGSYKNHDLAGTNPNTTQFEPTESTPIRQHAQMAGDPTGGDSIGTYLAGKFDKASKKAEKDMQKAPPAKEDSTSRRKQLDKQIDG